MSLPQLDRQVAEVIDTVRVLEWEVQDRDGRWYSLRLRPYKTANGRVDGAVLVLVDVDALKRNERELQESQEKYRLLVEGAQGSP